MRVVTFYSSLVVILETCSLEDACILFSNLFVMEHFITDH